MINQFLKLVYLHVNNCRYTIYIYNIPSDVEPIDMEYLLEDNQRVVDFLEAGTQEDTQRFIGLLEAKIDQEWEARKAVSQAGVTSWILFRPDIYTYVERNRIGHFLQEKKIPPWYNNS